MTNFELIIKNPDGSKYWSEGFQTKIELNKWLKEEQSRPYWKKGFTFEIIDNTEAIKEIERERKEKQEAVFKEIERARGELKKFREIPSPDLSAVVAALNQVLDLLGIEKAPEPKNK
jgi:hypothetical protein